MPLTAGAYDFFLWWQSNMGFVQEWAFDLVAEQHGRLLRLKPTAKMENNDRSR